MSKSDSDSITVWFEHLRDGHPDAAAKLWEQFFERLADVARATLVSRRVADEEDVAAGVMMALCARADRGNLPSIDNRDDLWRMLLSWTRNDCIDLARNEARIKRGGGTVRGDSVFAGVDDGFDLIAGATPTAQTLVEMNEQYEWLLQRLGDRALQQIATRKMEGYSNDELAADLNVSVRTIERKLEMIRRRWSAVDLG